jgi:hypothetical protein
MSDIDGAITYSRIIVIKNDNNLITLQLFPNPATDLLQAEIPGGQKETVILSISDVTGKIVYRKEMHLAEGMNAISIPVSHLSKGQYYLIAENTEGRQSASFIKQ